MKLPKLPAPGRLAKPSHKGAGHSIAKLGWQAFVAGALILVVTALLLYLLLLAQTQRSRQQQIDILADSFANRIGDAMAQHSGTMELLVKDPEIAQAISDGDEQVLQHKEKELGYLFPSAVRVRLLKPGIDEIDTSTSPQLGYACLDLVHRAELSDTPPSAEVHVFGSPQQHIDQVRRILSPTGRRIVGTLLVSYPVQTLQDAIDKIRLTGGYLELQQPTGTGQDLVLATRGDPALKGGTSMRQVPVPGTRWSLVFWPTAGQGMLDSAGQLYFAGIVAAAVVLLGLLLLLMFRLFAGELRRDLVTIITLAKDTNEGRPKRDYPVRLSDARGTVELLARMARETVGVGGPPVIERGAAQPASVEPGASLLYQGNALDVGEVDVEHVKLDPSIFKAYDIRGIVGSSLTAEVSYELGRAIGSECAERNQQGVIVARDGRLSGPELAEALSSGLRASGMDVIDIGRVPTPVLYFATHYLSTSSGVMVTGSHNPPEYNGLKIMVAGEALSGEAIQRLQSRIESGKLVSGEGGRQVVDVVPDYIGRIASDVRLARPMKVVVDCGSGAAGEVAPRLLRELGCEVVELYCEIDGNFPHHHPDPSRPENLTDLIKAVQENDADLGVAFDGDGDRLGVIDSRGKIIWPDRVLMLFAMDVLSRHPGSDIIFDVKCSRHLERIITENGGRPLMWKTGHSLIKAKIKETGAQLAGEMSGHIFFRERWFGFDDALYAAARLLEILSADSRTTKSVFAALPDSINTPELNVRMNDREHFRFMQRLLTSARFDGARLSTIDGLRADFKDGWGLVRASNTTPSLVLRFEADNQQALERIENQFRRLMLELEPNLTLPF